MNRKDVKRRQSSHMKAQNADPNSTFNRGRNDQGNVEKRLAAISEAIKKKWKDPEYRKKNLESLKSESCSKRHSRACRRLWKDPKSSYNSRERSEKVSRSKVKAHADPTSAYNSEEKARRYAKSIGLQPNKAEKKLSYILRTTCPGEYKYNGDFRLGVSFAGRIPDFWNVNGRKRVVELFGDYWHGQELTGTTKSGEVRKVKNKYRKCGVDCLVIWEHELSNPEKLRKRIINFA
jgi:hypothetical protein